MKTNISLTPNTLEGRREIGRSRLHKLIAKSIIIFILSIYCIASIIPFYFIFIRSFTATKDSTQLHLWLPEMKEFNMDNKFGNLAVFYNLDVKKFKKDFKITGYMDSQATVAEIAEQYNIPPDKIKRYLEPFYIFNGWYVILSGGRFVKSLFVTIGIAFLSIILGALLSLATGSILARFRKPWHLAAYNVYMLQIIIPSAMIMLPLYLIVSKFLHLDNNYLALILLNIQGGALPTMLFTSHVASIPVELQESVQMDGGNRLHYFFKIIIPLSKIAIAAFAAIRIPSYWNELLNGFLFLNRDKYPLIPMLNAISGTYTTNFQAIYSGLVFSVLPLLILYLFFQKLFVQSMMAGAIKG